MLKGDVDFSNYDAPLFQQIVTRIKAKLAARLGEGVNTQRPLFHDSFRLPGQKAQSGVFALVHLRDTVLAHGKQPRLTAVRLCRSLSVVFDLQGQSAIQNLKRLAYCE